jgi:hypothetical protein
MLLWGYRMKKFLLVFLIIFMLSSAVHAGEIFGGTASAPSSGGGGGGSKVPDIDNFIRQMEGWKNNYPERFDYLKKLLYKEPFTTQKYVPPAVWVYYPPENNTTVSRNEEIDIGAVVLNQNPIEIRRALYLNLEAQGPGDTEFKPAKTGTQITQVNEYDDKTNTTVRIFPDFKSFSYLKRVGDVKLRIKVSDGQYDYYSSIQNDSPKDGYYGDLKMKVYDIPPRINNSTMYVSQSSDRWDDFIEYTASLEDDHLNDSLTPSINKDQNAVFVTLHILLNGTEMNNITKPFLMGDPVIFSTKDKNIFNETDAGKNFSYCYSCTDGVIGGNNTTWSEVKNGPYLRPNPKIKVDDLTMKSEDGNYYWWQKYAFGVRMKSQNKDGETVMVALYTDTPTYPKRYVLSKPVYLSGANYTDVSFTDVSPFDVADCSKTFRYYFTYTSPDQYGKYESSLADGPQEINPRLISYDIASFPAVANLLVIIMAALIIGIAIERRFYR